MQGRKRKPLERQIAEGDPRQRGKHALEAKLARVPRPTRGLLECPRHLKGRARKAWLFWATELEDMQLDARCDALMLEAACMNYQTAVKAHLKIEKQGEVIEDPIVSRDTGQVLAYRLKKNPWIAVRGDAQRLLLAFASEFGVSPAARTRLNVSAPAHESDEDVQATLYGPTLSDAEKKKLQ